MRTHRSVVAFFSASARSAERKLGTLNPAYQDVFSLYNPGSLKKKNILQVVVHVKPRKIDH